MHRFARLFEQLSLSPEAPSQTRLLVDYLRAVPEADAAWAVALLAGATPGPRLPRRTLRDSARLASGLPDWLFDACLAASGDLADTLAQVLPHPPHPDDEALAQWIEQRLLPMRDQPAQALFQAATHWWTLLAPPARYLLAKLLSPGWRPPVTSPVLQAALAQHTALDTRTLAQRLRTFLAAPITALPAAYRTLITAAVTPQADPGDTNPPPAPTYPFAHAPLIQAPPDDLIQSPDDWWVFWRYEGIPAQLVKRDGHAFLWLADDRLANDHLPEVITAAEALPDGLVLEGQLLAWPAGAHRPEGTPALAARLKRQPAPRTAATRHPVRFLVHDLLAYPAQDLRSQPFEHRRQALALHLPSDAPTLALAQRLPVPDASALARLHRTSRAEGAHGLVLHHRNGTPWIWPAPPLEVLATLVYAQSGGAMRSGYTHYSFALWNRAPSNAQEVAQALHRLDNRSSAAADPLRLVTVAKVAVEDTGPCQTMLAQSVQATFTVRNGPVYTVRPEQVFELHVGAISPSARHKCGLHLQEVRVHRARSDKALQDADNLAVLRAMLDGPGP